MLRFLYGFAVLVYSIFAIGVQIHLHYCCGKLRDMSFYAQAKSCCDHDSKETCSLDHNCCDFKKIAFESKDEYHHQPKFSFCVDEISSNVYQWYADQEKSSITDECFIHVLDQAPDWPCYIRFSSLLFYA